VLNIGTGTGASAGQINQSFISGIRGITTVNNDAIAVLIDSAGQLGTVSSTMKVKHAIEDMNDESSTILDLRPVTFVYNGDVSEKKQYGLIAEEVNEIFPSIVVRNKDGEIETVQYHVLPVLLLNEMKKQNTIIQNLMERIKILEAL
jgi:chorismate mutase